MDSAAIAWAVKKLTAFGVANNTMDNALMMDRLEAMLKFPALASTKPAAPSVPLSEPADKRNLVVAYEAMKRAQDHPAVTSLVPSSAGGTSNIGASRPILRESLSDFEIDAIAESMEGGLAGFLKTWGWRQYARAIEAAVHGDTQPNQEEP